MAEQYPYTNRLIHEKSPYLQQHAHNPVEWYPWGQDAFTVAAEQDKPIFLSIGYSTCHWCHVMERESFENLDVAQLLNESFVCVKVDREELPEIDNLYMEFAQGMMAGAAGWPLNVVLTPELQPFFAATYMPPTGRQGMMGLVDLVHRIHEIWEGEEREQVIQQAHGIVDVFQQNIHTMGDEVPSKDLLQDAAEMLFRMADPIYGGIKGAPKFPIGFQQNLMMRYSLTNKDSRAMFLVDRTLDMMQRGGIYDHLGGGFSRYSVDEQWLTPHFEKMLYDNALILMSYLEAWQATQNPLYHTIIDEVLTYILRDMTHVEGGFYSAEDADSEGHEGFFYTWTYKEVMALIGNYEHADQFCDYFGITPAGNFEGRNILHTPLRLEEFAKKALIDPKMFDSEVREYKRVLFLARQERIHPFKDDKILSSWNGLMIAAMAQVGAAFNDMRYLEAAERAARFIKGHLYVEGQLMHRWREGQSGFLGGLDDYASMIKAAIALFETARGVEWLQWAMELTQLTETHFKAEKGAYFMTTELEPFVILRKCQYSDGAEPSGNALHTENLLKLNQMSEERHFIESAEDVFRAADKFIEQYPPGYCYHLMNLVHYYDSNAPTIVVALNHKQEFMSEIRHRIFKKFIPHKAVIWRHEGDEALFQYLPFVREQGPINGNTTLYICRKGVCKQPVYEFSEICNELDNL